jgi:hypothetical protein
MYQAAFLDFFAGFSPRKIGNGFLGGLEVEAVLPEGAANDHDRRAVDVPLL